MGAVTVAPTVQTYVVMAPGVHWDTGNGRATRDNVMRTSQTATMARQGTTSMDQRLAALSINSSESDTGHSTMKHRSGTTVPQPQQARTETWCLAHTDPPLESATVPASQHFSHVTDLVRITVEDDQGFERYADKAHERQGANDSRSTVKNRKSDDDAESFETPMSVIPNASEDSDAKLPFPHTSVDVEREGPYGGFLI